jgi:hypothetical protein
MEQKLQSIPLLPVPPIFFCFLIALFSSIRENVAQRILSIQGKHPTFLPHLAIVQVGARPDSTTYIRMKEKATQAVGIKYTHVALPESSSVSQIVEQVEKLNNDIGVSGVLVQLPLGPHIDSQGERTVTEAISPEKDVDGYVVPPFLIEMTDNAQCLIGFMRTTSATYPPRMQTHCLLHAHLWVSFVYSSTLMSQSLARMR